MDDLDVNVRKLVRYEDWPTRLANFIEGRRYKPFDWGSNDCCLFACDAVLAITGDDLARWFRGTYDDKRGAFVALRKFASGGIFETAERQAVEYSIPRVSLPFAKRGDVVVGRVILPDTLELTDSLGIVVGPFALFVGPDGLSASPTLSCKAAWSI